MRIGFIGLGVMGFPMAGHLANAGHQVTVYNRTQSKAALWQESYQGQTAPTPSACAKDQDMVFICVGNDQDVEEVILGQEGAIHSMTSGSLVIDHTTASAQLAQAMSSALQEKQIGFIDAPVSGGQQGAELGQLTIMAGGDEQDIERARPVMEIYAKACVHIGDTGSGQMAKMVNQICLAGVIQGLSEGLHFAKSANLDVERVLQAISKGAAQSWQMDHRAHTMMADHYDHGFAVDWMRKDLNIALEQAKVSGADLPVTQIIDGFYQEVQEMGGQRWDTSSLLKRLDR